MTKSTTQSVTNAELVTFYQRKKAKSDRSTTSYDTARVINQDVINKRKVSAAAKVLDREWAYFARIPLDILNPKQPVSSTPRR